MAVRNLTESMKTFYRKKGKKKGSWHEWQPFTRKLARSQHTVDNALILNKMRACVRMLASLSGGLAPQAFPAHCQNISQRRISLPLDTFLTKTNRSNKSSLIANTHKDKQ